MSEYSVGFRITASVEAFKRALSSANESVLDLKKSMRQFDFGRNLVSTIGVGAIIGSFNAIIDGAREARDEAERLGKPLDDSIARVAKLGDVFSAFGHKVKSVATESISFFTKVGEGIGILINAAFRGQNAETQASYADMEKAAEEAEKRLAEKRKEYAEKTKNIEAELAKKREEYHIASISAEERLSELLKKREELEKTISSMLEGSPARLQKELELENLKTEQLKVQEKVTKNSDDHAKQVRDTRERLRKEHQEYLDDEEKQQKELNRLKYEALSDEDKLTVLKKEQAELEKTISYENSHAINSTEEQIDLQKNLNEQKTLEVALQKKSADEAERAKRADEERAKIRTIPGGFAVRGHEKFAEASDEALAELVSQRRNLAASNQNPSSWGTGSGFSQQLAAAMANADADAAQRELDFRENLRRDVSMRGVAGARSSFAGDPLMFDRAVQTYVQDSRTTQDLLSQTADLLRQMNERQKSGIPVLALNKPPGG